MKRLFKRYRKLLNRFFVAVVVSVCLINTVSLDAHAAVVEGNPDVDLLLDFGKSYVTNHEWGTSYHTQLMPGGHLTDYLVFNFGSNNFDKGNHVVAQFLVNFWVGDPTGSLLNAPQLHVDESTLKFLNPLPAEYDFNISVSPTSSRFISGSTNVGSSVYFTISGDYDFLDTFEFSFLGIVDGSSTMSSTRTLYFSCEVVYVQISDTMNPNGDVLDRIDQNTNETNNKLDDVMNGYDSSSGDAASGKLDGSVSDFEQAEGSIFDSAQGHLKDFEFFDFNSIPAVVTGLSFVTSSMTAVFDAMGGLSGAGIVLSVLFAVMFLSIVIGLYRYFK